MNYETAVVRALKDIARELRRIRQLLSGEDKPCAPEGANGQQEGEKKDA